MSILPVARSPVNPATTANQSLGHQSGPGKFPLYFFCRRLERHVGGHCVRRASCFINRSCARGHVDRGHRWRDHFANSSRDGSRPAASLPQHAARFQTAIAHVDGRMDSTHSDVSPFPGLIALELARTSSFPANSIHLCASPPALFISVPRFGNVARDLYRRAYRRDRDSSVVFASQCSCRFILERPAWDLPRQCSNCLGTANRAAQCARFFRRRQSKRFSGSGWRSTNTARPIARCTKMVPAGSFVSAKCSAARSAFVLRLTSIIPFAAIVFVLGALLSRFGWIAAGRVSGSDPEAVFASQKI